MSYLYRPRVNFKGVYTTNVPTTNNNKVRDFVDQNYVKIKTTYGMSDDEFRTWLMQTVEDDQKTVWLNSYFNYFGDCAFSYERRIPGVEMSASLETRIQSSQLPNNVNIDSAKVDPFIQAKVSLLGHPFFDRPGTAKMVDSDPIGIYGTQIFSGEFNVTWTRVQGESVLLSGKDPSIAFIRYLNFSRNIDPTQVGPQMGAAIWLMTIPNNNLTFASGVESQTLKALQQGAAAGKGLQIRYCTYFNIDGYSEAEMGVVFQNVEYGQPLLNPAWGQLTGTVGIWTNDDILKSTPVARLLYPGASIPMETPHARVETRDRVSAQELGSASQTSTYQLAPAFAVVDTTSQTIVIDITTAIPERNSQLDKVDLGTLILKADQTVIGSIPAEMYNKSAYEKYAGIVEIPYSSQNLTQIQNGLLSISTPLVSQPVLQEINFAAVETDDRVLYMTEGQSLTFEVVALVKGKPATQPVTIAVSEYQFVVLPGSAVPPRGVAPVTPDQSGISYPATVTTDNTGRCKITVTANRPYSPMLVFTSPGDTISPGPLPKAPTFGYLFYNIFRILPQDTYDLNNVTWEQVYNEVLRYYYLVYPGMFARLEMQKEEVTRENANFIRQLISKRIWNNTSYMPVTRELSDGKRMLLQKWLTMNE